MGTQPLPVTVLYASSRAHSTGENWSRICWRVLARRTLAAAVAREESLAAAHTPKLLRCTCAHGVAPLLLRAQLGALGSPPLWGHEAGSPRTAAPSPPQLWLPLPPLSPDTNRIGGLLWRGLLHRSFSSLCLTRELAPPGGPDRQGRREVSCWLCPGGWNSSNIRSLFKKYGAASKHD